MMSFCGWWLWHFSNFLREYYFERYWNGSESDPRSILVCCQNIIILQRFYDVDDLYDVEWLYDVQYVYHHTGIGLQVTYVCLLDNVRIRGLLIQPYLCQHFFSPSSWCLSVDGGCDTFQIFSENIILRDSEWVRIRSSDKLLVWYRVIVWCCVYLYYIIYYYIEQHFFGVE